MESRRNFLKNLGWGGLWSMSGHLILKDIEKSFHSLSNKYASFSLDEIVQDESYWYQIRQMYSVSPNIVNLNNGGVSPQPLVVQEAVERYNRLSNETPSYYMWRIVDKGREAVRSHLARLASCSPEELAINRNSSEALETIIFGLPLKKGDEVILSKQDYPNMMNAWKQREERDGIVLKWIDFQFPIEDDQTIIEAFEQRITDKTKVAHITHVLNWNGQIMPVKKIATMLKSYGIEVVVDGAHSFAHIDFSIPDLSCDYFGTSLHKWLCAPFGTGMLYVKKNKIQNLYPLLASPDPKSSDIRKFEHLGTRSFAVEQAIGQAVLFHEMIGMERKQARLQYLKNYWASKALEIDGFSLSTSLNPKYSCAIAVLSHESLIPQEISSILFQKYNIHTTVVQHTNISGVRITPNVYTLTDELDRLIHALSKIEKN